MYKTIEVVSVSRAFTILPWRHLKRFVKKLAEIQRIGESNLFGNSGDWLVGLLQQVGGKH